MQEWINGKGWDRHEQERLHKLANFSFIVSHKKEVNLFCKYYYKKYMDTVAWLYLSTIPNLNCTLNSLRTNPFKINVVIAPSWNVLFYFYLACRQYTVIYIYLYTSTLLDATVRWVKCKPMYVYSCLRRLSSKKYKKFAVNF